MDTLKFIKESRPAELMELFLSLGLYLFMDTNAETMTITSENGFNMDVKFSPPEGYPYDSDDKRPRFDETLYDSLRMKKVQIDCPNGKPPTFEDYCNLEHIESVQSFVGKVGWTKEPSFGVFTDNTNDILNQKLMDLGMDTEVEIIIGEIKKKKDEDENEKDA